MTDLATVTSLRTNAPLRNLTIGGALGLAWIMGAFGWLLIAAGGELSQLDASSSTRFQTVSAYLIPGMVLVFVGILFQIARQGTVFQSRGLLLLGCLFIAGGATLDLSVTFYFSPQLTEEGNPIVRVLLETGHSLPWVIAHMILSTILVVGLFCAFWWAFLAHESYLLQTILADGPQNGIDFLKAATGGGHLTIRQWLFPRRISELPRLYHSIWMVGIAIVFGITAFRYYVSLEWLGVFEPALWPRVVALFSGLTLTLVVYFWGLSRRYHAFFAAHSPGIPSSRNFSGRLD